MNLQFIEEEMTTIYEHRHIGFFTIVHGFNHGYNRFNHGNNGFNHCHLHILKCPHKITPTPSTPSHFTYKSLSSLPKKKLTKSCLTRHTTTFLITSTAPIISAYCK